MTRELRDGGRDLNERLRCVRECHLKLRVRVTRDPEIAGWTFYDSVETWLPK